MKFLYWRSVVSKDTGRWRLIHHHRGGWNKSKWMRWVWRSGAIKFVARENGRNPEKNLPRLRFVHHETYMEWPRRELGTPGMGEERLTAWATEPPTWALLHQNLTLILHSLTSITKMCTMLKYTIYFNVLRPKYSILLKLILIDYMMKHYDTYLKIYLYI